MRPGWKLVVAAALMAVAYSHGGATIVKDRGGNPVVQTGGERAKAATDHDRPPYSFIGAIARDGWLARCMTWPWRWLSRPAPNLASPNLASPNLASPNLASPSLASPTLAAPSLAAPPRRPMAPP